MWKTARPRVLRASRLVGQAAVARRFAHMAREAALEDGLASVLNLVADLMRALGPEPTGAQDSPST